MFASSANDHPRLWFATFTFLLRRMGTEVGRVDQTCANLPFHFLGHRSICLFIKVAAADPALVRNNNHLVSAGLYSLKRSGHSVVNGDLLRIATVIHIAHQGS